MLRLFSLYGKTLVRLSGVFAGVLPKSVPEDWSVANLGGKAS